SNIGDFRSDLLDDSDRLVTEDVTLGHERCQDLVQVQIGTAQPTRRDPHDRIGRLFDPRVRYCPDTDVTFAVPHHCSHWAPSTVGFPRLVPHAAGDLNQVGRGVPVPAAPPVL